MTTERFTCPLGEFTAKPPLGSDAGNEIAAQYQRRVEIPPERHPDAATALLEDAEEIERRLRTPDVSPRGIPTLDESVFFSSGDGKEAHARSVRPRPVVAAPTKEKFRGEKLSHAAAMARMRGRKA